MLRNAGQALAGLPATAVAVLPDDAPYAYALPGKGGKRDRIVASTGMPGALSAPERRALLAHERVHLLEGRAANTSALTGGA